MNVVYLFNIHLLFLNYEHVILSYMKIFSKVVESKHFVHGILGEYDSTRVLCYDGVRIKTNKHMLCAANKLTVKVHIHLLYIFLIFTCRVNLI